MADRGIPEALAQEAVARGLQAARSHRFPSMVGAGGVGKTSLVRRYTVDHFDDRYIKTIGTKVSKKSVNIFDGSRDRDTEVILTIWDIMGQEGFRELLKEAYFMGANGILAVCDVTSTDSMDRLDGWLDRTYRIAGEVPVSILINKTDLKDRSGINEESLRQFGRAYECPFFFTSAKTGENVEKVFRDLAERIVRKDSGQMQEELLTV